MAGATTAPRKAAKPPSAQPEAPRPTLNALAAMDDPNLFGPHFQGDTWRTWRVFLKAWTATPMDAAELAIYRHHTGRTDPPTQAFTEGTAIVGRRGGKSRLFALLATCMATLRDYSPHLAPGEVATVAIIAADRRQARVIFRYIVGMLEAVPITHGVPAAAFEAWRAEAARNNVAAVAAGHVFAV